MAALLAVFLSFIHDCKLLFKVSIWCMYFLGGVRCLKKRFLITKAKSAVCVSQLTDNLLDITSIACVATLDFQFCIAA